jgi:hypothetical protein
MKRKTTALRYTLLTAALISLPSLAPAALLTYEGFGDYTTNGPVHGLNGGQGWNGGWVVQNNSNNYPIASSGPLTFGPLVTSANHRYLYGGYQWFSVGRELDISANGPWASKSYVSGGFINNKVLWFSMLAQINTTAEVNFTFTNSVTTWNPGENGNVRIRTTGGNWELGTVGATNFSNAGTRNNNTTYFVVGRFHLNNTASTFHLWVRSMSDPNPLNLGGPDLNVNTANASLTGLDAATVGFRNFSINVNTDVTSIAKIDEIRFGETFADVSPIPEPSTYALLAAGLGALVWLRRRAKAKV